MTIRMRTPIGCLVARLDGDGALASLGTVEGESGAFAVLEAPPGAAAERVVTQLGEYFARTREVFDLPLAPEGTEFQRRVWAELTRIPFGRTWTYGQLAERLGGATLTRAVGRANGANPIAIVVPCHRVIGANGDLVGYAGGLPMKRALLRHEGALLL
jgi:methylated-DNA-[protein]-cysteine S-methyltransferase